MGIPFFIQRTANIFASRATLRIILTLIFGGAFHSPATTYYVSTSNRNPAPPYQTLSTAATNIQDAINVATNGDLVLVAGGTYKFGGLVIYGTLTNRVAVNKPLTVQSIAGSANTIIQGIPTLGNNAARCVYLTNNAILSGFTLTNGGTLSTGNAIQNCSGGGVWSEGTSATISNCVITTSVAFDCGGGSYSGTLINCMLTNNTATNLNLTAAGGGACGGILTNCTLAFNVSAMMGGGACSNTLFNCTLYTNQSKMYGGGAYACSLTGCTLTNNAAGMGGGAYLGVLTNCALISNQTTGVYSEGGGAASVYATNCLFEYNGGASGGGAYQSYLEDCTLSGNTAETGGGAYGGTLVNCQSTGNTAYGSGGGVYSANLTNCTLSANIAEGGGGGSVNGILTRCSIFANNLSLTENPSTSVNGGGADGGVLIDCVLNANGGALGCAAYKSTLINCTVTGNPTFVNAVGIITTATCNCKITNSIIYYNETSYNDSNSIMDHCCSIHTSQSTLVSCITNNPMFYTNFFEGSHISTYFLQSNSACIDAGDTSYAVGSVDFYNRQRVVGASVDMGATEYQGANYQPFIYWLLQYNLPVNGTTDFADSDGDGMNNWQEWIAGTNPTNAISALELNTPVTSALHTTLTWQSVTNRTYYLQQSTNLMASPAFVSIQSNIVGVANASLTSFTVTNVSGSGPVFYRVGVQ